MGPGKQSTYFIRILTLIALGGNTLAIGSVSLLSSVPSATLQPGSNQALTNPAATNQALTQPAATNQALSNPAPTNQVVPFPTQPALPQTATPAAAPVQAPGGISWIPNGSGPQQIFYYCSSPPGYYPSVQGCATNWLPVYSN